MFEIQKSEATEGVIPQWLLRGAQHRHRGLPSAMSNDDKVFIPNSFQTPNVYVDEVMAYVSGAAFKILMIITRYILGWHHRGGVQMGHAAVKEICGLSHQGIINGAEELKKLGLILIKKGPRNSGIPNAYFLNLDLTTGELLKKLDQSKKLSTQSSQKSRLLVVKKVDTLNINKETKRESVLTHPHALLTEEPKSAVDKQLLSDHPTIPPHPKEKQTRAAPAVDSRVKAFFDWWATQYEIRFRAKYVFNGGKEGKLIKALPTDYDIAKLKSLASRFFDSDDEWIKQRGGYTLGVFISQLNKLASTGGAHSKPAEVKELGDGWLEVDGMKISRKDFDRRQWKTA